MRFRVAHRLQFSSTWTVSPPPSALIFITFGIRLRAIRLPSGDRVTPGHTVHSPYLDHGSGSAARIPEFRRVRVRWPATRRRPISFRPQTRTVRTRVLTLNRNFLPSLIVRTRLLRTFHERIRKTFSTAVAVRS
jgi:hypothetical protein